MSLARRLSAVAGLAVAVALAPACRKRIEDVDVAAARNPQTPRERCRAAFAACAPPITFALDANVSRLDVRKLVHLASRLDVADRLSADAAKELRRIASAGDADELLDIQEAMESSTYTLGKCRCEGFSPEIEKQGVAALVAKRAPPRALRLPEHWTERILARLDELHALSRRSAELAVSGGDAANGELDARRREAERQLCETVHAARDALAPAVYAAALELVYRRRAQAAGEGSADLARRMLARHETSASCDAP